MSVEVSIHLQVYDDASNVIQAFSGNLDSAFNEVTASTNQVTQATQTMGDAFTQASSQVDEINAAYAGADGAAQQATASFSSQALTLNNLALSAATLYMSFERVENSQVALDRANLNVQKSTNSLQAATEAYNKALAGGDPQKVADALAKLNTAQDALTVSNERADMAQRNLNNSYIYAALTVVPSLAAAFKGISDIADKFGISTQTLAVSAGAAIASFVGVYEVLNSLPAPMRETASVIAIVIGVLIAATVAAAAFWGTISLGTAVPIILASVGAAVAGVMVAMQGATSAATTFAGSTGQVLTGFAALNAAENQFITNENARYQQALTDIQTYWNTRLGVTQTGLQKIDAQITDYYTKEENAATAANTAEVNAANAAYAKQLTDYTSYWSQKLGLQTTELTTVDNEINRYYDQEISDTQSTYKNLIDQCNQYYDNLEAANNAGLAAIQAARQSDLDKLEENMLVQKVALETAHNEGLVSDTDYQTQVTAIDDAYNKQRGDMSDSYRLQELQAEDTQKTNSVGIETDRTTALTTLATNEATAETGITTQKNTDLETAQSQYANITTTALQTLNDTLKSLATDLATAIVNIENQKNADLQTAYTQNEAAAQTHMDNLNSINQAGVNTSIQIFSSYTDALGNVSSYQGAVVSNLPTPATTAPAGTTAPSGGQQRVMQHGGIVTEPTLALIGEAGPEAVIPLGAVAGGMVAQGRPEVNVTVHVGDVNGITDISKLTDVLRSYGYELSELIAEAYGRKAY